MVLREIARKSWWKKQKMEAEPAKKKPSRGKGLEESRIGKPWRSLVSTVGS